MREVIKMLLSLALAFAERRRQIGATPSSTPPHKFIQAMPAAVAGFVLGVSIAEEFGISLKQLPNFLRNGGEEVKAQFLALVDQIARVLTLHHPAPRALKAVPEGGAGVDAHPAANEAEGSAVVPAPKPKKVRITAFDSIRFFLIAYIMSGHFIAFADPSRFAFKAITQINVVVGAFFALSGYVAAYTTTELQERSASDKLLKTPTPKWILQKIFGYYPLHLLVLTIFSPMFLYSDVHYSGWPTAIMDMLLEVTLSQAWFPMHAEVWNAPTWFLSALSYSTVVLRMALPNIARQNKHQLTHTAAFLFLAGLLPKLGYCDDHDAWGLLEGAMQPSKMPNLAVFNTQRFNPLYASIEVLLGAVACRLVMLDGAKDEDKAPEARIWDTLLPLLGMFDVILLRARGRLHLSDVLTRGTIFIPLFLRFLMSVHRASMKPELKDPIVKALNHPALVYLGNLSFPIFVVHGPLGQLFYKKLIATKVFGAPLNKKIGPQFFYVYLASCVASALVLQKTFLSSKKVSEVSKEAVEELSHILE